MALRYPCRLALYAACFIACAEDDNSQTHAPKTDASAAVDAGNPASEGPSTSARADAATSDETESLDATLAPTPSVDAAIGAIIDAAALTSEGTDSASAASLADAASTSPQASSDAAIGNDAASAATTCTSSDCALEAQIEDTLASLLQAGQATGYSVAIWRDDAVIYAEGFGTKNPESEPVTRDTLFQIGSDTKKLTAMTVLQSAARGRIDLSESIGAQLGDLDLLSDPGRLHEISVHDLLTMRSGLHNYVPWVHAPEDSQLNDWAYGRFAEHAYGLLPPAIAWTYGNANYSLLGLLVERAEERPWATVLTEDVFEPLGMNRSYARLQDMLDHETDIASGYGLRSAGDPFDPSRAPLPAVGWVVPEAQLDNGFVRPAGLVWSTAADQARLLGYLAQGAQADDLGVLNVEQRRTLLQAHVPMQNHSETNSYGYGVTVQSGFYDTTGQYRAVELVGHGGQTLSMTSMSLLLPEQAVAVVILANAANADVFTPAMQLLQAAAAERLPEATDAPSERPPLDDLEAYVGRYVDALFGPAEITLGEGGLSISLPLLTEAGSVVDPTLEPVALDLFVATVDDVPYFLSFYAGPDGEPHYAISGPEPIVLVRQE